MIKLYVMPRCGNKPYFILFQTLGGPVEERLFQHVNVEQLRQTYTIVEQPQEADFVAIPHNYYSIANEYSYIQQCQATAESAQKKMLVFAYGDSDKPIKFPNAIIFRTSQYKHQLQPYEIIMPAYVEDLGAEGITYRAKHAGKPIVSFVGWASFKTMKQRVRFMLKFCLITLKSFIASKAFLQLPGIYFRRKAIQSLTSSPEVESRIITRTSYSGHRKTIEKNPTEARQEYVEYISNADYALAVKGDGNYSLRFYEILSLGRIPVFVDTDCPLPLEDLIDYDAFMLRVDYKKQHDLARIVAEAYAAVTPEAFIDMQRKARQAYENYLSINQFFKITFERLQTLQ